MKAVLLLVALTSLAAAKKNKDKPHIVLVLADDFGHANIGYNRDPTDPAAAEIHTPNMDKLAGEGVILERHYTYRICGPSRASLQSGRLASHVNVFNTGVTVENEDDPVSGFTGIPRNMTIFATKLKKGGYTTHFVGKWDVGMATPEHTPIGRGYESFVGYYTHANDYWNKGMGKPEDGEAFAIVGEMDNCANAFTDLTRQEVDRDGNIIFNGGPTDKRFTSEATYEEDIFVERALQIINGHDPEDPLFLFYSSHLIHTPLQVPKKYHEIVTKLTASKGDKRTYDLLSRKLYAAMVYYLDEALGLMVHALKAKKMYDNTLLVFISDNGGPVYIPGAANNHPLRGGKYGDFEGGIRGNAFVTGGHVPESAVGSKFNGLVSIADWYTTFCHVAGVPYIDSQAAAANPWLKENKLPQLHPVDGRNQWEAIVSGTAEKPTKQNVRADYFHISPETVIKYPWKLITGKHPYGFWQGNTFPNCSGTADGKYEATWPKAGRHGPTFTDFKMMDIPVFIGGKLADYDKQTFTIDCGKLGCLYNIEIDPSEHHDVAEDHPELRVELLNTLMALNMSIFDPFRGHPSFNSCAAAIDNGGFYGPFSHVPENWFTKRERTSEQILADAVLKAKLKVFADPEVRKSMANAAQKYGESEKAVRSMHTVDVCLNPAGEKVKTHYCAPATPGPCGHDEQCEELDTTLEYPEHKLFHTKGKI